MIAMFTTIPVEKRSTISTHDGQVPDSVDLPIVLMLQKMCKNCMGKWHCHTRGQLIYPCNGRYRIHFANQILSGSAWQAIWIPPHTHHKLEPIDNLCVHNVYIDTTTVLGLPQQLKTFKVSFLLSALLSEGAVLAKKAQYQAEFGRVSAVIVDQIRLAEPLDAIALPLSYHPKIQTIMEHLLNDPSDPRSLVDWADLVHTSPRTLTRLFVRETGLTFTIWKQRLYVKKALALLANGCSVIQVAFDLGYSNQGAFTQMFRRVTGRLPSDFLPANSKVCGYADSSKGSTCFR